MSASAQRYLRPAPYLSNKRHAKWGTDGDRDVSIRTTVDVATGLRDAGLRRGAFELRSGLTSLRAGSDVACPLIPTLPTHLGSGRRVSAHRRRRTSILRAQRSAQELHLSGRGQLAAAKAARQADQVIRCLDRLCLGVSITA